MIYLVIGVVAFLVIGFACAKVNENTPFGTLLDFVSGFMAAFSLLGAFAGACAVAIMGYSWVAASHQADIINREYGTSYTQQEVFYASGVIDTVRELQRQRIELNGDLNLPERDQ